MRYENADRPTLYRPSFEKDNCGFGLIAHMDGKPSHWVLSTAIESLGRLTHRGAVAADGKTGDGCGLLIKKPDGFLRAIAGEQGWQLADRYAVGTIFLSTDADKAARARDTLDQALADEGVTVLGWREVPTDASACGEEALKTLPRIEQVFINAPDGMDDQDFGRRLFTARRVTEKVIEPDDEHFYITSLSSQVLSYKGLVMPSYLPVFYQDLNDPRMETAICVFHQRFSTNTWPQWRLAQPFRFLAHNGEINTVQGNRNWANARAAKFETPLIPDMDKVAPLVSSEGSDSNSLDNMLDAMLAGGMDIFRTLRILIPPAWQNVDSMDADLRAFYEYHSMHVEPWDGPAGIVLTEGRHAACVLDRNGLRPARYVITKDRHITLASEIGVYDYDAEDVEAKGRLKPGEMLAVDTETGELLLPNTIDDRLKQRKPYKRWLHDHLQRLESTLEETELEDSGTPIGEDDLPTFKKMYNLTLEENDSVVRVLAEGGQEAVGSMGDDTPLPVLSRNERALYDYFRQQFAQVTNPAIDPLREQIVMSLETCLGRELNVFEETEEHAKRLVVESPVLSRTKFLVLLNQDDPAYANHVIDLQYPESEGLKAAIERVADEAEEAVRDGNVIIVLSDRYVDEGKLPIHALLATGAVHHRLVAKGLRCDANIVVETATARDPHHFATLIGYGATAIYPYLAYAAIRNMRSSGQIKLTPVDQLRRNYRKGINKGLFKILSKMGISTIASYRGAQLFEIVGLADDVVDLCFTGTVSRIKGSRFQDLETDQKTLAREAFSRRTVVRKGGLLKFVQNGEYHAYNPDVVQHLQEAVETGDREAWDRFSDLVNTRQPMVFRDLLKVTEQSAALDIDDVEPIEEILPRFDSAGMSLGALSPEAHESLAIAMNRLGGRSNSGEGGEDEARYGTERMSKIKQVASGRFGVTPHYLVNAEVLQIKVAQGAKPGEGGQLPGHKVNEMIGRLRFSKPGVALISPPPHHDIYSIEDLAQLIYDLKRVNGRARVGVKLVATSGVGTIAAGVAKGYADVIQVSGHDGGTGASPLSSMKHAGVPWELGLAETQQVLVENGLRQRVLLRVDGGLKTGRDVIVAALLGAEAYGFGTAALVASGCAMIRQCHLNTCPVGIATQREDLRAKYQGEPEHVIRFMTYVAQQVRMLLARLGARNLDDLIGRVDLLQPRDVALPKPVRLDWSALLRDPDPSGTVPRRRMQARNQRPEREPLDEQLVRDAAPALERAERVERSYAISNRDRSLGARLAGELARRYGDAGVPAGTIRFRFRGAAGQSFGAFMVSGTHLTLTGEAQDYVGKGMAGGELVVRPAPGGPASERSVIVGNTVLYGATGGALYASGQAGERLGVRNSGALAVVEGCGDHGCEYMTGGVVVVLGATGRNFGAGMSGGLAYVWDPSERLPGRVNAGMVRLLSLDAPEAPEVALLRALIERHVALTDSAHARRLLEVWGRTVASTWLVAPRPSSEDVDVPELAVPDLAHAALARLHEAGSVSAIAPGND